MTLSDEAPPPATSAETRANTAVPTALNAGRRRNMQANRRRDTGPERAIRSLLHRAGYRYRCDLRIDLPGGLRVRPDIVFTRRRLAIFVDGCFWHCCPEHGRQPSVNEWYWSPKLTRNQERDIRNTAALRAAGWTVLRIWEHEPAEAAAETVLTILQDDQATTPSLCQERRRPKSGGGAACETGRCR